MDEPELRAVLTEILDVVRKLATELERYRELLPDPDSIKGRVLRRKVAASAVEHWKES